MPLAALPAIIGGVVAGGGAIAGAAIGGSAAKSAADTQAQAALEAAQIQKGEFEQGLDFEKGIYGTAQQNLDPYIAAGRGNLAELEGMLPGLTTPYASFGAPSAADVLANDPGYNFRLQQGIDALQNSAAARGSLLSGGTAKELINYGQGFASNEYANAYQRALQTYGANQSNYYTGQQNAFNRYAQLSNGGLSAAAILGSEGSSSAAQIAQTLGLLGQSQAQGINTAAGASAAGTVGAANAITGGITGATNNIASTLTLQQLINASRNSGYTPTSPSGYGPSGVPLAPWSTQPYSGEENALSAGPV